MSWLDMRKSSGRLACLWQVVAWLCCILAVCPATSHALRSPVGTLVPCPAEAEGEERPAAPEDDDSEGESGKAGANGLTARRNRQRLATAPGVPLAWRTHLPHHHGAASGYALPVCSPFERGARLPLRC